MLDGEGPRLLGSPRFPAPADLTPRLSARAHRRAEVPRYRAPRKPACTENAGSPAQQASGSPWILRESPPLRVAPGTGERHTSLEVPVGRPHSADAGPSGARRRRSPARVLRCRDPGRRRPRRMVGSAIRGDTQCRGPGSRALADRPILARGPLREGREASTRSCSARGKERPPQGGIRARPDRPRLPENLRSSPIARPSRVRARGARVRPSPPVARVVHPVRAASRRPRGGCPDVGRAQQPGDDARVRWQGPANRGQGSAGIRRVPRGVLSHEQAGWKGQDFSRQRGKSLFPRGPIASDRDGGPEPRRSKGYGRRAVRAARFRRGGPAWSKAPG